MARDRDRQQASDGTLTDENLVDPDLSSDAGATAEQTEQTPAPVRPPDRLAEDGFAGGVQDAVARASGNRGAIPLAHRSRRAGMIDVVVRQQYVGDDGAGPQSFDVLDDSPEAGRKPGVDQDEPIGGLHEEDIAPATPVKP